MVKGSAQLGAAIKGAFDGINNLDIEEKNNSINEELENCTIVEKDNCTIKEDKKIKPGYRFYESAIGMLEDMQLNMYPRNKNGRKTPMETIINDAIKHWYEVKKNEGK